MVTCGIFTVCLTHQINLKVKFRETAVDAFSIFTLPRFRAGAGSVAGRGQGVAELRLYLLEERSRVLQYCMIFAPNYKIRDKTSQIPLTTFSSGQPALRHNQSVNRVILECVQSPFLDKYFMVVC